MKQPDETFNKLLPRVVILALTGKPNLWYFVTLWDLPADNVQFPPPENMVIDVNPDWGITYRYDYDVPTATTGKTITHICTPIAVFEGSDISKFDNISIVTGKPKKPSPKTKQGRIDHTRVNSLPQDPGADTGVVCNPFVLQSDTNLESYFAGAIVEIPSTGELMDMRISEDNNSELRVHYAGGLNANSTKIRITRAVDSDNGQFSSIAIYGDDTLQATGIIIGEGTNLYENAIKPPVNTSAVSEQS